MDKGGVEPVTTPAGSTAQDGVKLDVPSVDSKEVEDKEKFTDYWQKYATEFLRTYITLISEPQTEAQLAAALTACS
eukprot:7207729-Pyramimonas_sp.AAC.1